MKNQTFSLLQDENPHNLLSNNNMYFPFPGVIFAFLDPDRALHIRIESRSRKTGLNASLCSGVQPRRLLCPNGQTPGAPSGISRSSCTTILIIFIAVFWILWIC